MLRQDSLELVSRLIDHELQNIYQLREVSFFTGRGGLWKFFKFCKFLVIPPTV